MKVLSRCLVVVMMLGLAGRALAEEPTSGLREWLGAVTRGLEKANAALEAGDLNKARSEALKAYLDNFEVIEGWYGTNGTYRGATRNNNRRRRSRLSRAAAVQLGR